MEQEGDCCVASSIKTARDVAGFDNSNPLLRFPHTFPLPPTTTPAPSWGLSFHAHNLQLLPSPYVRFSLVRALLDISHFTTTADISLIKTILLSSLRS